MFAEYLLCNVLDCITGWTKARKTHKESSGIGIAGIAKKVGYWIIILVEYGINVPEFLIKGLAITEKLISAGADTGEK